VEVATHVQVGAAPHSSCKRAPSCGAGAVPLHTCGSLALHLCLSNGYSTVNSIPFFSRLACSAQLLHDDNLRKLPFSSIVAVYDSNTRQVRRVDVLKFTLYLASTQLCFLGMRRISANHSNCRMLHMWNASHFLNVHYWSCGCRFETCRVSASTRVCGSALQILLGIGCSSLASSTRMS
jgi:hypothetical protein